MLEKDRFLENLKKILIILFILFVTKEAVTTEIKSEIKNYNNKLKNTSALFIQTDGTTIEEGIIYIGSERIKIDYTQPKNITLVLSEKKGMYINHELQETQYFNSKKSVVSVLFKIINGDSFFTNSAIKEFKDTVTINNIFEINEINYYVEAIYEIYPIKLRKIKIKENNQNIEIGFFNHSSSENKDKSFYSLINPYIIN